MNSARVARQVSLVVGGSAIIVMGALTAGCSSTTKEEPKTTPSSTSSSAPAVAPSEKAVGGPSSFSPTVNPVPPGNSCTKIVNGVCVR